MSEFRQPAVQIQQGKRTLFLTSFTVRDFLSDGFYRVDRLDVQGAKGMQRLLSKARARSFAKDISEADDHNEAFLPTSVFLATEGSISYDEHRHQIFFDSNQTHSVCPFDVVDGQHRIEGLKIAAENNERLLDFPISVVVAHKMNETEKMLQFVTVNTKQKAVDQGVAQHITARFTQMLNVENLPHLPAWLRREVEKGTDDRGLEIAKILNSDERSPWCGRIQFADEAKGGGHTITQKSFVTTVKKIILNKYHPFNSLPVTEDKKVPVLINYFRAIDEVFVDEEDGFDGKNASIVYKYIGLEFFLTIFGPTLNVLMKGTSFTTDTFIEQFHHVGEYLESDSAAAMSPDYWRAGNAAGNLNRAGIQNLANEFTKVIQNTAEHEVEI